MKSLEDQSSHAGRAESSSSRLDEDLNVLDQDFSNELNKFEQRMLSPDGGMKSVKSSKQHVFQIKTIISVIDPERNKSSTLLDARLLSDRFLMACVQVRQFLPGTTKSYLNYVLHWFKYVLANKENLLSVKLKISIQTMCDCVRRRINSLRGQSQKRFF